ncbi:DUF1698 domain-containing protein [Desulfonatronum sp. SC1]|uniref:DUF1698 domain-containing protein n=1 Tax=Desulfonatronum sp. SC1 TaxID=2109626 RepID=UPI000D2FF23A|nr:DUF1698 domain-containing protein [Desulfonatronum sp. SC1]PTN34154.1 hypothetical protein C6366_13510 [Desulfonatronum sp. SC1]
MYTLEEISVKVLQYSPWYHKIYLGHGITTPGRDYDKIWNMIRETRNVLDFNNKIVLDLGSFDGMWAFEAEQLGANIVVATDCYYENFYKFLFCREMLQSNVVPYYNVSPYRLFDRLDVFLQESWKGEKPYDRLFDIVQHLGIFYHLRDPLLSLSQARSVLKTGGHLLMETAIVLNEDKPIMLFNCSPPKQKIYNDITTWWAPSLECLKEMLKSTLFETIDESIKILTVPSKSDGELSVTRASLVARAVSGDNIDKSLYRELTRTYRNPGLNTDWI